MIAAYDNNPTIDIYTSPVDKLLQNLFIAILPFYPFWAWLTYKAVNKSFDFFLSFLLIPFVLYYLVYVNKKLSKYVIFLIIFTIYHLGSVFVNDTFPEDANKVYFFFSDPNVLACLFFIIIDYVVFTDAFIRKMSRAILFVVFISLVVSIIQIKIPTFFFNTVADAELAYIVGEGRNFSIYSWISLNSAGITFPILISILLSVYALKKSVTFFAVFSGIVVAFLTRTRYVMISTVIAFSQLLFNKKQSITKRASYVVLLVVSVFFLVFAAEQFGYNFNEVIEERILEKSSDMGSAKTRLLSYEVFMQVFPDNPFFGVGPETRQDVINLLGGEAPIIHIGYLCYLYYYGMVGCLFLFLSLFYLLKEAWNVGKQTEFWGGFYGLISFCIANLTLVYFNLNEMGIVLAVVYVKYYSRAYESKIEDDEAEQETVFSNSFASKAAPLPFKN